MSKPLVTFALFSYNQKEFISEALRGALAQTYSPLQIVVSDDCSSDGSFDVILEETRAYRGPHEILLNRNERNLGIGAHVNRVMELVEGELIVVGAGDDVSRPNRTEELVKRWTPGGDVFSVYSDFRIIDEHGRKAHEPTDAPATVVPWQEAVRTGEIYLPGCTHAWDRRVFEVFGPLPEGLVYEDIAIPFRSVLLGRIVSAGECLIDYRRHTANSWKDAEDLLNMDLARFAEYSAEQARRWRKNFESWHRDLKTFASLRPELEAETAPALEALTRKVEFAELKEAAFVGNLPSMSSRLGKIGRMRAQGFKYAAKASLLSVSPRAYRRMHWWQSRRSARRDMRTRPREV